MGKTKKSGLSKSWSVYSVNAALAGHRLKAQDVAADGNCLFRSLSVHLFGDEEAHAEIRDKVCDFMATNRDWFAMFVENDEPWDSYLSRMRRDGTWAGNLELVAASRLYLAHMMIHQVGGPAWSILCEPPSSAKCTWHLVYLNDEHYAAAVPLNPGDPLPAAINEADSRIEAEETKQKLKIILESVPNPDVTPESALAELQRLDYDLDRTIEYFIDVFNNEDKKSEKKGKEKNKSEEDDDGKKQKGEEAEDENKVHDDNARNQKKKISKQQKKRLKEDEKRKQRKSAAASEPNEDHAEDAFAALKI